MASAISTKSKFAKDVNSLVVTRAEWIGITGQGAVSKYGISFIENLENLEINKDLPKPVDHILIQSDNTAIAPGRLEIDVARTLDSIADIESRGGATVYRFSEASIREV